MQPERETIEGLVLRAFSTALADKEAVETFVGAYVAERRRIAQDAIANRSRLEAELKEIEDRRLCLIRAYCHGHVPEDVLAAETPILKREIERVKAAINVSPSIDMAAINEDATIRYRAIVEEIAVSIDTQELGEPMLGRFREFVGLVIIEPTEARKPVSSRLYGVLGSLVKNDISAIAVVAEEGLEPPTYGL